MRIVIEIDDGPGRSELAADPGSGASGDDGAAGAAGAAGASGAGADTGEDAVEAGPGPGADADTSDQAAADGGEPSASLLEEVAAAEQLGRDGDTSEATDAGAGPHES
jgi:hypothetical protein